MVPQYPPPPPQHILSPKVCTLFRNFTSVVLHFDLILIFHGLYNVSRSLCSPGGPTYIPSSSVSYFCCFVLSLICKFVVSYFLYFVAYQFRYFTHSCFTLYGSVHFAPVLICSPILIFHGVMFPDLYFPQYLCSTIPMFPGPMFPDT